MTLLPNTGLSLWLPSGNFQRLPADHTGVKPRLPIGTFRGLHEGPSNPHLSGLHIFPALLLTRIPSFPSWVQHPHPSGPRRHPARPRSVRKCEAQLSMRKVMAPPSGWWEEETVTHESTWRPNITNIVTHTCNPSTEKAEAGRSLEPKS